jgi:hypothetical protein
MRRFTLIVLMFLLTTSIVFSQDLTVVLEPDHCFIWVSEDAPEAELLRAFGLNQDKDPEVVRAGNGASWISFSFENFYLELMWVHDEDAFKENWVWWNNTHDDRAHWENTGASPFGLAFHRVNPDTLNLPFKVAEHFNPVRDGGWVDHGNPQLPHIFVMGPRGAMPDPWWMTPEARERARTHPAGIRRLTKLRLGTPQLPTHAAFQVLNQQGALDSYASEEHVLELTFDDRRQGKTYDARPGLPLIFHY